MSLAGRPPFATNEPETFYQSSPQPRAPVPQQQPAAKRTSAYDVYDNYLQPGEGAANRNSGIGALGMGFMNADMDDSDDEDDEEDLRRARSAAVPPSPSKHAALAAATGATTTSPKGPFAPERLETPPPQYKQQQQQQTPTRTPATPTRAPASPAIAAPRPGYAAPMTALNQSANNGIARPAPSAAPAGRVPASGGHPNLRIVAPAPSPPGSPFAPGSPYGTPSPSASPHPLQAPVTPITPIFARPQRTQTMTSDQSVAFSDQGLIMRGDGEGRVLARGRGEKGEQFWRRFSMVAKDPDEKRPSSWLKDTQGSTSSLRRWVWIIGVILVICAAGGIGLGVYISEKASANYRPAAIGGSANDGGSAILTTSSTATGKSVAAAIATSSALHVSPTNTVARREPLPHATAAAGHALRNRHTAAHFAL
ncbi:hypothetical protein DFH07DRAFT_884799 [Mycena maculata]|uniref:Uncharacterized protein n=1 Tax=Mycena maculata TaxID=230809 RepID=A0AAD7J825_9AGAR|nr:hypothetical protein DFH07DRAFT_884799 [Mycena maculata]